MIDKPISLDFSGVDTTEVAPKPYFEIWKGSTLLFSPKEIESLIREEIDPEEERGGRLRRIRRKQLAELGDISLEDKFRTLEEERGGTRLIVFLEVVGFYQGEKLAVIEDTED